MNAIAAMPSGAMPARHDAIAANVVPDAAPLRSTHTERHALTLEAVWDLRARLAADQKAIDWDLVDFVDMMLASGLRIGETAAVCEPAVDLDAGTVAVRGTVIRIKGAGLVIKPKPKSRSGWRTVELPGWGLDMVRRRIARVDNQWRAVFTSPLGQLREPSNTQAGLRSVLDRIGYADVTSHTFRRTVATLLDKAGLCARAAGDQLGHAKPSKTQDLYFGRGESSTGAAEVLEDIDRPEDER